ncbi:hypothetical protein ERJ75_001072300 [Trypanosoma vivax]|nr:hypothetical protein ERJ75_001072300 [Trypanosoma vivax]
MLRRGRARRVCSCVPRGSVVPLAVCLCAVRARVGVSVVRFSWRHFFAPCPRAHARLGSLAVVQGSVPDVHSNLAFWGCVTVFYWVRIAGQKYTVCVTGVPRAQNRGRPHHAVCHAPRRVPSSAAATTLRREVATPCGCRVCLHREHDRHEKARCFDEAQNTASLAPRVSRTRCADATPRASGGCRALSCVRGLCAWTVCAAPVRMSWRCCAACFGGAFRCLAPATVRHPASGRCAALGAASVSARGPACRWVCWRDALPAPPLLPVAACCGGRGVAAGVSAPPALCRAPCGAGGLAWRAARVLWIPQLGRGCARRGA